MATVIYSVKKCDLKHSAPGIWADIDGCFLGPVGPFNSREDAATWIAEEAECLTRLYGPAAAEVTVTA